ncbi:MAG: CRISPR-associated protein Cas4 [Methanothrix sp.]|nr:CRISPR-associated protein Cas4 [Methanothrix sp.]
MDLFLGLFILVLLALAAVFQLISKRVASSARSMRQAYGIPDGKVIYSDLDRPAKALHSKSLDISGKPDYIVKGKGKSLIPVEIKSGRAKEPYAGHILQLAAYCRMVEENYRKPVPYGIIVYSDGIQHRINFDRALRHDLETTVEEMRQSMKHDCPKRSHNHKQKCLHCSFKDSCRSSLT